MKLKNTQKLDYLLGIKDKTNLRNVISTLADVHATREEWDLASKHQLDAINLLEEINKPRVFLRPFKDVHNELSNIKQEIILCGHSHQPQLVQLPTGKIIVNPGSVGLPAYQDELPHVHFMETGSPHARYCIISKKNKWHFEHLAIPYDWEKASVLAAKNNRPDWVKWLQTGRSL